MLNHFYLNLNSEVTCYACPYSLSAILTQNCMDENKKVVALASI